jgi:hypothetical protein
MSLTLPSANGLLSADRWFAKGSLGFALMSIAGTGELLDKVHGQHAFEAKKSLIEIICDDNGSGDKADSAGSPCVVALFSDAIVDSGRRCDVNSLCEFYIPSLVQQNFFQEETLQGKTEEFCKEGNSKQRGRVASTGFIKATA